jgi:hypothetical protein
MRYGPFIVLLCIVSRAAADQAANGANGVNAKVTGLSGTNVPIAVVEDDRSGKAGYDSPANSASNTAPTGVYFQTGGGQDSASAACGLSQNCSRSREARLWHLCSGFFASVPWSNYSRSAAHTANNACRATIARKSDN